MRVFKTKSNNKTKTENIIVRTCVLLFAMLFSVSCQKPEQQQEEKNVGVASTVIEPKTVQCELCANTIKQADGVKKLSVEMEKKPANVEYVSGKTTLTSLEAAIAQVSMTQIH